MITYLKGKVVQKFENRVLLEVENTGYDIFVPHTFLEEVNTGEEAKIFTYLQVKEDGFTLFGFNSLAELEFFKILISVSGVGPKIGLNLISTLGMDKLALAITRENLAVLTSVPGIGPKTARLIVLVLKEKILKFMPHEARSKMISAEEKLLEEVKEALVSLGYSQKEAREGLAKIESAFWQKKPQIEEALKAALRFV